MIFNKITILTVILAFCFTTKANSAVLDAQILAREIEKDITACIQQEHKGKVEVEVVALPYQTIELPDGNIEIKTETTLQNINSTILKVNIYVNNIKVKTFGARVEIKIYDKVWVAQNFLQRGDTLKNLKLEEKNISSMPGIAAKENFDPTNYLTKRNVKPGEIINLNYIEEIPMIVKNSPVSLIFKTPLVSITVPAIAVDEGKVGDFIKVKNKAYGKSYVGKIIGENIVLVNI